MLLTYCTIMKIYGNIPQMALKVAENRLRGGKKTIYNIYIDFNRPFLCNLIRGKDRIKCLRMPSRQ